MSFYTLMDRLIEKLAVRGCVGEWKRLCNSLMCVGLFLLIFTMFWFVWVGQIVTSVYATGYE